MLLAISGCAEMTGPPQSNPSVRPSTDVAVQRNGNFVSIVGPRRQHSETFLGVPNTNYYALRSLIDTRTGELRHQLYAEDSYMGAKREYDAARDGDGTPLPFAAISTNEITCDNGCSYAEEFAATLPDPLLRSHPQGLTVAFTAKSGPELTIAVPGDLIKQQLAVADDARASFPAAAAPPPR